MLYYQTGVCAQCSATKLLLIVFFGQKTDVTLSFRKMFSDQFLCQDSFDLIYRVL